MDTTLVEENRLLTEELTKCKADKEFVWSLWKQLQSESPDLTTAVDTAISREKKKYEAQIEKVVQMVQKKDREIASLKQIIRCQDEKLLEAEVQESKMLAETNQRNDIVKELEERLSALTVIVTEAEQQRIKNTERQQSWTAEVKKLKQRLMQVEKERGITQKLCQDQENELLLQRNSQEELNQNLSKLSAECIEHIKMCNELREELQLKDKQFEALQQSVYHKDMQINGLSEQLQRSQHEFKTSESQLDMVQSALEGKRKEVTTSQQQLLLAQQQVMVIQQKCSQLEGYAESHTHLQVARTEIEKLRVAAVERDQKLLQLSKLSEAAQSTCQERTNSLQSVVQELTALHEVLTKERAEHELVVKGLKEELLKTNNRMLRELELARQHLSPSTELTVSPTGLHAAVTPSQESTRLTELLVMTEKELFSTKSLLEAKDNEVMATRKAHSQRLARMKALQIEYKLVVEQLKTYETEKSPQQKSRNIGRSMAHSKGKSPQSGEVLWSQLTSYKRQVESLCRKLSQAEEEKDRVQVKLAREQTTAAELQANFEAERNELMKKLNGLASKTTTITEEERMKVKEMEGIIKSLQQEKTSSVNAHRTLEKQYYELQEEMARTKSALLLAEKKAKELTTSPVSTVERCSSAVQTDHHYSNSPRIRHGSPRTIQQFDITCRSSATQKMYPYRNNYHSRSLSDTFLHCHDFQESDTHSSSQLSSSSSLNETTEGPILQQHNKSSGMVKVDKVVEKSAPVTMVDIAVQSSCDEQQSLIAKRNTIHQQIISKFQRENKSLKHRLATLSKQVEVLNSTKQSLTKALQQEKDQCEALRTEAASHNDKLQQCKAKIQSLSDDVTRLTEENNTLKERYNLLENIKMKAAVISAADKPVSGHTEAEWKSLEQRMKSILEKYSSQNSTIQELQKQLQDKTIEHNQIQERLHHCERDVRQKRTFIENLRSRLRTEKYCQAEWEDTKANLQQEISVLTERSVQHKQQIDYLKKQLNREQHEKEHLCVMNSKCAEELELTLQKLDYCRVELKQREKTHTTETSRLHKASQELKTIRATHQHQMTHINSQLKQKDLTINELHNFTKELAMEIATLVKSRVKQKQNTEDADDETLANRARKIAFSTLNLSATEFEQFVTESEIEKQSSDEKFIQQINAVLDSKPPFSTKLVGLFMRIMNSDN